MASSKGKANNRSVKKRTAERTSRPAVRTRVRQTPRKRAGTPHQRQSSDSANIPRLLYDLLTIDRYNQDVKRESSGRRFRTSRRRARSCRERRRLPYETIDHRDSPESVQVAGYTTESGPTSVESLTTEATDAANSSAAPPSSADSSVSNISMEPITLANSLNNARGLFKKRSLVQLINRYIKAGIEEGKRQAEKYITKALSFGVKSGYLIPTNPRGNVLRVCSTLESFGRADRTESRRKRRVARRGDTRPTTTIEDRRAMRRGIPRGRSHREAPAETITSSNRRQRKYPGESPVRSTSTREGSQRKSPGRSRLRERNKSKTDPQRKRIDDKANGKVGQRRKRGDIEDVKKPASKRRRTTSSPKRVENNYEPIEECCANVNDDNRNRYASNGDNYRATSERRKSTASREDGSRIERQKPGTSVDDVDRDDERRGNDDDEKSEEASVERDANGTTEEIIDV